MPLLKAVIFSSLWAFGFGQLKLEQPKISVSRIRYQHAIISCKVFSNNFDNAYIHWYRQKLGQNLEHLMYVVSTTNLAQHKVDGKTKLEASKDSRASTSTLKIIYLEKEDEATYYCASWDHNIKAANITYTKINSRSVPHPSQYREPQRPHVWASILSLPSCRTGVVYFFIIVQR